MEEDKDLQYFVKKVFLFLWHKHKLHDVSNTPEKEVSISCSDEAAKSIIEIMGKVVFMQSCATRQIFQRYLRKNFNRMTTSWKLYLTYVIYAIYTINDGIYNVNERLAYILTLVVNIDVFFFNRGHKEFIQYSGNIFCKFFDKAMRKNFYVGGGWRCLHQDLLNSQYLEWYERTEGDRKDQASTKRTTIQVLEKLELMLPLFFKAYSAEEVEESDIESHQPTLLVVNEILNINHWDSINIEQ